MLKKEAEKRIQKLRAEIARLRNLYHTENAPNITDEVYDSLTKELKNLLEEYPEFQDFNASENRVAGKPLDKFEKGAHTTPMFSIGNVFSEEELFAWEKRNLKLLGSKYEKEEINYFCELKFDGLAVSLIYENGKFIRGLTRGDGKIGEDITQNLKTIKSIPLVLKSPFPPYLEVRGEVIMRKAVLEKLNKKNIKEGKQVFANSRNAAAGSLRQLDPELAKERSLDFFAYEITEIKGEKWQEYTAKHSLKHKALKELGFMVDISAKEVRNLSEAPSFIEKISKIREGLPFGIDGAVISINDTRVYQSLGVAGKDPRGVIAFKYPAEKATTVVKNILINVGRTGVLTPLAVFSPTKVAGSVVSKATLHNMDQIERLDLRIGDTVVIEKAGDVIPKVLEVLFKLRTGKEKKFKMPEKCPVCGEGVEKRTIGGVLGSHSKSPQFSSRHALSQTIFHGTQNTSEKSVGYYCVNKKCPAKNERYLEHFISAFEIYELGPKILRRFKDEGLITDAADVFTLSKEDIAPLERFGEKSAENIVKEIEMKKKISFSKFIWALGILHVGEETSRDLALNFSNLENLKKASFEDLNNIENIGEVVARSICEYFKDKKNLEFIKKLQKNGVVIEKEKEKIGDKFSGMTFVLTGTLTTFSREMAKEKIISLGGKVASSVSKNTSFVLVGEEPGSKLKEAEKLGVKIIKEAEFLKMIL